MPAPRAKAVAGTFAEIVKTLLGPAPVGHVGFGHAPLAHREYDAELAVKEEALGRFWKENGLAGEPAPLVASPRPRGYRTTSKRRVGIRNGKVCLFLGDQAPDRRSVDFLASPLEPPEHATIYRALTRVLNESPFRRLATHLNFAILRGSYTERALVLSVDALSRPIVVEIKALAENLRQLALSAVFVYLDPTRSDYHFEGRRPDAPVTFKRIYGPDHLTARFCGHRYSYHPTSFCQVNESIVPLLLAQARDLLSPDGNETLLDLYCGFGLFTHYLAPFYRSALGVDAEGASIRCAVANSRQNPAAAGKKFVAARITPDFVSRLLPRPRGREVVLLDPPRNGPQPGVIAALGRRSPTKVLHVFCDVDQIPIAMRQWQKAGYGVRRVVPLDMFPGSANLEVLVLLAASFGGANSRG